jgi:hypothetical protein
VCNFENSENKVEYKSEYYEIIQCRGNPELLKAESVSSIKFPVPESEKN